MVFRKNIRNINIYCATDGWKEEIYKTESFCAFFVDTHHRI